MKESQYFHRQLLFSVFTYKLYLCEAKNRYNARFSYCLAINFVYGFALEDEITFIAIIFDLKSFEALVVILKSHIWLKRIPRKEPRMVELIHRLK